MAPQIQFGSKYFHKPALFILGSEITSGTDSQEVLNETEQEAVDQARVEEKKEVVAQFREVAQAVMTNGLCGMVVGTNYERWAHEHKGSTAGARAIEKDRYGDNHRFCYIGFC